MTFLRLVLLGGITLVGSLSAQAHEVNLSTARIILGAGRAVAVEVALKGSDADRLSGTHVFDPQRDSVDPVLVAASAEPMLLWSAETAPHA